MPSQSLIKLMAHEYNTSEEWILKGTGDMFTHKPYNDKPSNMEKTNHLFFMLDDLLCETPSSIRNLQENILETVILLFNSSKNLQPNSKYDFLEILNKMLENLYTLNTYLIVSKDMESTVASMSHKERIEKLMDEIFQEFASDLEKFKDIYDTE